MPMVTRCRTNLSLHPPACERCQSRMATMNQTDKLTAAARQALRVLACYDAAGKGGMTFAAWQSKRLAALHALIEALRPEQSPSRSDGFGDRW